MTVAIVEVGSGMLLARGISLAPSLIMPPPGTALPQALLPYELPNTLKHRKTFQPYNGHSDPVLVEGRIIEDTGYEDPGPIAGRLAKNFNGRTKLYVAETGHVIFDNRLRTDEFRRRIARPPGSERHSPQHFLMFGCSFVFGTAVDDEATMPWQFNELQTHFEAYNLGGGGYGPNDTLARLLAGDYLDGVTQKQGVAVYGFLPENILRTIGSTSIGWRGQLSTLEETAPGHFEYRGTFENASPLKFRVYEWLAGLNIFQFLNVHLPRLRDSDYGLVARMFVAIREDYRKRTSPENSFVVVLFPFGKSTIDVKKLRAALSKNQVHFVDYSQDFIANYVDGPASVEYDGHTTGAANRVMVETLIMDLSLDSKKISGQANNDGTRSR